MSRLYTGLRDVQQDAPVAICGRCSGEVWSEETMYFYDGKWICYDCFKESITSLLDSDPQQIALEMQIDMQRYV